MRSERFEIRGDSTTFEDQFIRLETKKKGTLKETKKKFSLVGNVIFSGHKNWRRFGMAIFSSECLSVSREYRCEGEP